VPGRGAPLRGEEPGRPGAVLAVDETGFLKKGRMSAGVARHVYRDGGAGGELPGGGVPGVRGAGREQGADRPGAVPAGEVDGRPGPVPGRRDRR
jgi:hypothetical protein